MPPPYGKSWIRHCNVLDLTGWFYVTSWRSVFGRPSNGFKTLPHYNISLLSPLCFVGLLPIVITCYNNFGFATMIRVRQVIIQWKATINGKPSVPKIQNMSTSGFRNGCALMPNNCDDCHNIIYLTLANLPNVAHCQTAFPKRWISF